MSAYEAIFNEWEAELSDLRVKVFRSLKSAYPNGRTRRELIRDVYNVIVPDGVDLNNNKYDRKIRLTIAGMQEDLLPIVSSSGKAGYRLDLNCENIERMVVEFSNRRAQYDYKITRANKLLLRVKYAREAAMPEQVTHPHLPRQMRLGETV